MKQKIITLERLECLDCALRLEKILNGIGFSAKVDLDSKTVYVDSSKESTDEELTDVIEFAGYKVVDIR